jgi:biotin-dependent carboxylase-like uncharacterized protein
MVVNVNKPGLATTVQDLGRPGYYHLGIPISGAMDRFALKAANLLVGNKEDDAGLEIVFAGPELLFDERRIVAVTGADLPAKLDGELRPSWTAFVVEAGQVLSFDFLKKGARAYLAISGGIDVPFVLGSRSTYPLGGLGGYQGRALKVGDVLKFGPGAAEPKPTAHVAPGLRRETAGEFELRVLPGLYWNRITDEAGVNFFADTWKVAPEADRIGYRFRGGRPLSFVPRQQPFGAGADPSNVVDCGYPYGSVQIPAGAEPIVLHRDAVTGGGYFMLGTVIAADMDLIGQMQPHQAMHFVKVDMDQALAARKAERHRLERLKAALL